jgi:hypothetical protein
MRGGVILKHFSARDVISRRDVAEVHHRATSLAYLTPHEFITSLVDEKNASFVLFLFPFWGGCFGQGQAKQHQPIIQKHRKKPCGPRSLRGDS